MRAVLIALLLSGCAFDVNGTHNKGGSPAATCTQAGPNLITCSTK